MNARSKLRWAALGLSTLAIVVTACDDDAVVSDGTPSETDGGVDANGGDGGTAPTLDAGRDASGDAASDAGPSNCSVDGFCHTELPEGKFLLRSVWSDGNGNAFAAGDEGKILRWDGTTWSVAFDTETTMLRTVWASSATDVWVGGDGGLFHGEGPSPDDLTWTHVPFADGIGVLAIDGTGAKDVWAVGSYGRYLSYPNFEYVSLVKHLTDGAPNAEESWARDDVSDFSGQVQRVAVLPSGDVWLFGDYSANFFTQLPAFILHREQGDDGALHFVQKEAPVTSGIFYQVDNVGIVGDEIRVVGWNSSQRGTTSSWRGAAGATPAARSWSEDSSPVTIYHHWGGIWGTGPNDVYLASQFGRFRHFDGTKWNYPRISIDGMPVTNDFFAMHAVPSKELWIVGQNIALHKSFND